jgi:hypothetical protein
MKGSYRWLGIIAVAMIVSVGSARTALASPIVFNFEEQSPTFGGSVSLITSTVGGLTVSIHRADNGPMGIVGTPINWPASWGLRTISNFLGVEAVGPSTLIFDLSSPVFVGGISFGDFPGAEDDSPVTISAFSGAGATGANLGVFAASYTGVVGIGNGNSDSGVGSVQVTAVAPALSFTISSGGPFPGSLYWDNFTVDAAAPAAVLPEPASMLLFGTGLVVAGLRRRARR